MCDTIFLARHGYHGMIGLPSTARRRRMTLLFMAWSVSDHKTRDHLITGMIRYGITRFHFCQDPTLLRGVICRVKGVICREKGVICREKGVICHNWETTHFQFRNSRFFRYDRGDKPWAHTTHIAKLSDPVLIFLTLGPWLPLHLSLASWVFLS